MGKPRTVVPPQLQGCRVQAGIQLGEGSSGQGRSSAGAGAVMRNPRAAHCVRAVTPEHTRQAPTHLHSHAAAEWGLKARGRHQDGLAKPCTEVTGTSRGRDTRTGINTHAHDTATTGAHSRRRATGCKKGHAGLHPWPRTKTTALGAVQLGSGGPAPTPSSVQSRGRPPRLAQRGGVGVRWKGGRDVGQSLGLCVYTACLYELTCWLHDRTLKA